MPRLSYAPVARPLVYWPVPWFQDVHNGSRDAAAGLPDTRGSGTTPHIDTLSRGFADRAERERIRTTRRIAGLLDRRARESAAVAEFDDALSRARQELERVGEEPTERELTIRRLGETETAEVLVRERRRREHRRRSGPLTAAVTLGEQRLRTARAALDRTEGAISVHVGLAAARVARLHAHTLRRIGTYERRLLRTHPTPDALGALLTASRPVLPSWARPEPGALPL